jgi:hypothetical protein
VISSIHTGLEWVFEAVQLPRSIDGDLEGQAVVSKTSIPIVAERPFD